ncbi:MAG: hypothetical protein V7711_04040 [Pseudomonadales bacterium]
MTKYKKLAAIVPATALILGSSFASANEAWDNGFDIRLGAMAANNSTSLSFAGENEDIDFEESLGASDDINTGRLGIAWRFKDRHSLSLDVYQLNRSNSVVLDEDLDFVITDPDDPNSEVPVSIKAQGKISSNLDFKVYDLSYAYSFIQNEQHHLSASVGLYWMDIDFGLGVSGATEVEVDGEPWDGEGDFSTSASIGAPMPLFGVQYDYAISSNWLLGLNARYFGITVDPYSGSISNFELNTVYQWEHFYVGAGYTFVDIDIEVDDNDWNGALAWEFDGPSLFIGTRF